MFTEIGNCLTLKPLNTWIFVTPHRRVTDRCHLQIHAMKMEMLSLTSCGTCSFAIREGLKKWKFKTAFAMKGRGLACHKHFLNNDFFSSKTI